MKYERQDDCQSVTWATHSDRQTFNPMVNDRTAYLCTVGEHATSSQKGFSKRSDLNKEPSS